MIKTHIKKEEFSEVAKRLDTLEENIKEPLQEILYDKKSLSLDQVLIKI